MLRHRTLAVAGLILASACAPAVQINGALEVVPPECAADAAKPKAEGLLDIGVDPADGGTYEAAFGVTAVERDITYDAVTVFYTTDQDRAGELQLGQVPGVPINAQSQRRTTIGATSTSALVIAPIVTSADAALLQAEPFVANAINAGGEARIIANVKLEGKTAGGAVVESQLFPFPLTLCAGCLSVPPVCVDGAGSPVNPVQNTAACFVGDDVPDLVCP